MSHVILIVVTQLLPLLSYFTITEVRATRATILYGVVWELKYL